MSLVCPAYQRRRIIAGRVLSPDEKQRVTLLLSGRYFTVVATMGIKPRERKPPVDSS